MDKLQDYFSNILAHLDDMAKRTIFMMGVHYGEEKSREQRAATDDGEDFRLLTDTKEEVEKMIIELKISGSVRERKNGLIEFRNPQFGSVYGRTVEELKEKLQQKIRYEKAHIKKPEKKKKSPLLSVFYKEIYLPYKKRKNLAENTIKGIEYNFAFIKENFDKPIADYTPKDIETFLLSIEKTRKAQIIQGLLNNIFNKAVNDGLIKTNPCTTVERIEHITDAGKALSFEDQRRFFTALFSDTRTSMEQKCYFVFVYLTGTRRNEALATTENEVDFGKSTLHILGTKTEGSNRYIPLSPHVAALLKKLNGGKYFPFKDCTASRLFSRYIKGYKLHDLRHTFGTIQICVENIDEKTVSLWMGHSDITTTLEIYTHPEQLDRATFLRGDLSKDEKKAVYKAEYEQILALIETFLNA